MTVSRLCLLTETFYPVVGGGETQALSLARGLASRGAEVTVITRRSSRGLARTERVESIPVVRVPPSGESHVKKWGLLVTVIPSLLNRIARTDVVLVCGYRILGIPAMAIARWGGRPCILKADSLGEMSGEYFRAGLAKIGLSPSSYVVRRLVALRNGLLMKADRFIAISSEIECELVAAGVPRGAIRVIPNGVDTARFRPPTLSQRTTLRARLRLDEPARQVVIFTGRLVSYKGLPLLLRAWRVLCKKHPAALLLLVGSGGLDMHDCEEELRLYVRQHRLHDCVRFTGEVRNVEDYLQASDVFVLPTENEAFGLSLVEAMACDLAVVGTSTGGLVDVLAHGRDGLMIDPGCEDELVRALDVLLSDEPLRSRLGRTAAETACRRYSQAAVLDAYEGILSEVGRDSEA